MNLKITPIWDDYGSVSIQDIHGFIFTLLFPSFCTYIYTVKITRVHFHSSHIRGIKFKIWFCCCNFHAAHSNNPAVYSLSCFWINLNLCASTDRIKPFPKVWYFPWNLQQLRWMTDDANTKTIWTVRCHLLHPQKEDLCFRTWMPMLALGKLCGRWKSVP